MRLFRFLALLAPLPVLHVACVGDDPVASPSPQGDGGASSSSSSSSGGSSSGSSGDAGGGETAITGTVVDQVGNPVAGAEVRLESSGKIATTGVDGKFAFDAPAAYALTVVHPSESTSSKKALMAVVGLTTRQPRIQVVAGALRQSTSNTYRLQGIAPGVFPLPADARVSFVFEPDMVALPVTRTLSSAPQRSRSSAPVRRSRGTATTPSRASSTRCATRSTRTPRSSCRSTSRATAPPASRSRKGGRAITP